MNSLVLLSSGRMNRVLWRSPRTGQDRLLLSPVNRKARKRGVKPRLIQDVGSAPGLPAHNAVPERGIINTRGQGRALVNNRERGGWKRPQCRAVTQRCRWGFCELYWFLYRVGVGWILGVWFGSEHSILLVLVLRS